MTERISLEEQARELLARAGIKGVSTLTSGDLVEIANLIREARMARTEMADIDSLRAFALTVLEDWPEGAPDGFALQDLAVKHGLLVMKDPKCYVRSQLLLGTTGEIETSDEAQRARNNTQKEPAMVVEKTPPAKNPMTEWPWNVTKDNPQ